MDPSGRNPVALALTAGALALTLYTWYKYGPAAALEVAPFSGDLNDIYGGATGKSLFDGRTLSQAEKAMMTFAAAEPGLTGGQIREGNKIMGEVGDAVDGFGNKLSKELLKEELTSQAGKAIAGQGTNVQIKNIDRLVKQYGGSPEDWSKMTSDSHTLSNGTQVQYHWYENTKTGKGEKVDPKPVTTPSKKK